MTQGEVAELIGLAMEGHVPGPEDPSVRSAMGVPKQPKPGSAERLTRDLGPHIASALTASGSAALSLDAIPSLITPTPLGTVSGVRSATAHLVAPPALPTQTGPSRKLIAGVCLAVAALCGVGGAMFATRGTMQAVPLEPVLNVAPPTVEAPVVTGPTQAEIEARLRAEAQALEARLAAEAAAEEEAAAAEEEAERAAEEARQAARERARGRNMRATMMSTTMTGPLIVDDF